MWICKGWIQLANKIKIKIKDTWCYTQTQHGWQVQVDKSGRTIFGLSWIHRNLTKRLWGKWVILTENWNNSDKIMGAFPMDEFATVHIYWTKIQMQHFCFCPHFSWAELKDRRLFLCTQKAHFSQILFSNQSKPVSEHFSLVEIIHPPHICDISRCWSDSRITAQMCLRLATMKGHSMCSFITRPNATDVSGFEGEWNWQTDCRNVLQNCCPWIECLFLYRLQRRFRESGIRSNRPHDHRPGVTTPATQLVERK